MNIYTDGACKDNSRQDGVATGKGGWAYVVLKEVPGEDMEIIFKDSGHKDGTTNQEMEINAVAEAFKSIEGVDSKFINLYSDSAYVINCLKDRWFDKWRTNNWKNSKGTQVENREAWERMIGLVEKRNVKFFKIKRNSTKFIKMVDGMAKKASLGKIPAENNKCSSKNKSNDRTNCNNFGIECF